MPISTYAVAKEKMDLKSKALAANAGEFPHLEERRNRLDVLMSEVKSLTAQQASLTASKQEVTKRLAELIGEGRKLMAFLDVCVKEHYGKEAEKLLEFGIQPFRSEPRVRLVGPDGQPFKRPKPAEAAPQSPTTNP